MTHRLFAAFLALALLASLCFAAGKPVNDNAIYDNVRIKLAGDAEVKGGALGVDVKDGVVTLSGQVDTERQKSKAGKLARKVKGVKQVINNIALKQKYPAK
jgi:hyperosmotically inducible periplasmic protein